MNQTYITADCLSGIQLSNYFEEYFPFLLKDAPLDVCFDCTSKRLGACKLVSDVGYIIEYNIFTHNISNKLNSTKDYVSLGLELQKQALWSIYLKRFICAWKQNNALIPLVALFSRLGESWQQWTTKFSVFRLHVHMQWACKENRIIRWLNLHQELVIIIKIWWISK